MKTRDTMFPLECKERSEIIEDTYLCSSEHKQEVQRCPTAPSKAPAYLVPSIYSKHNIVAMITASNGESQQGGVYYLQGKSKIFSCKC